MDKDYIGQKIASSRKEKGFTQKELAERLCVSDKTVSKWETGVNFPDIAIIEKLAGELDISPIELLGLQGAESNEVIREIAQISLEEKEEIKKGIRFRAKWIILYCLFLIFAEIYLSYKLNEIGLQGGIYGAFTGGLVGMLGTILGCSLYSLINAKKL